jgi:hypothetical protein
VRPLAAALVLVDLDRRLWLLDCPPDQPEERGDRDLQDDEHPDEGLHLIEGTQARAG